MTDAKTNPTALFTCAKCDGRGRLDWTNQDDGVCYWCGGAGKIRADDHGLIRRAIASAEQAANLVASGIVWEKPDYARGYAKAVAEELAKVGTENARAFLAKLWSTALLFDEYDHPRAEPFGCTYRVRLTREEVAEQRRLIIEAGRALRASSEG